MYNVQEEFKNIYRKLNMELFNSCLPTPDFMIRFDKIRVHDWGYLVLKTKHIIRIHHTKLSEGVELFTQHMIHQMVHIYCAINFINDTSQRRVYHNKRFRNESEKRGLILGFEKGVGFFDIGIAPQIEELIQQSIKTQYDRIQEILQEEIEFVKQHEEYEKKASEIFERPMRRKVSSKDLVTFRCPSCGRCVYGLQSSKVICGWCGSTLLRG